MNVAIIDDLISDAQNLEHTILKTSKDLNISCKAYVFTDEKEFIKNYNSFTALFLDILMPNINGINLAKKIRVTNPNIPIIFVTTEKEYALYGYEVQAFDYLIKPASEERVSSIIKRLARINDKYSISLKIKHKTINLPIKSILYAQSRGHNVDIYTTAEKYTVYMSFKRFLELIPIDKSFFVYTRGSVVNFNNVIKLKDGIFILNDNTNLHISRSKINEMHENYTTYIFAKTRGELN